MEWKLPVVGFHWIFFYDYGSGRGLPNLVSMNPTSVFRTKNFEGSIKIIHTSAHTLANVRFRRLPATGSSSESSCLTFMNSSLFKSEHDLSPNRTTSTKRRTIGMLKPGWWTGDPESKEEKFYHDYYRGWETLLLRHSCFTLVGVFGTWDKDHSIHESFTRR